jgi:UDP-2,3-diacylglucosamine hydrolase
MLKRILRNPVSIFLFRLLHPDFARHIARISSKTSRTYLAPPGRADRYREIFREVADNKLAEGYDAVVYGHSHIELLERRNTGHLILLGDWLTLNTYILLENGEFSLYNWHVSSEVSNG